MVNRFCVVLRKTVDGVNVDSVLQSPQNLTEEEWQELIYVASSRVEEINDALDYEEEENILELLEPWEIQYGREGASIGKFLSRMNKDVSEVEFLVADYEDG